MIADFGTNLGQALVTTLGMIWQTAWTLVLGFTISSLLQSIVSTEEMRSALGRSGPRQIMLATVAGAASSSCSYASAAIARTLFKKGAALVPSLAFLFSSTNLVLELGIILYILMGWQFMAAEWLGGILLVIIMSTVVRLTYPAHLVAEARRHPEPGKGHNHMTAPVQGDTWKEKLTNPQTRIAIAQNFVMEWSMLWKDLAIGFIIGGLLSAFVPDGIWKSLFLADASPWIRIPLNALLGPIIASLTFVCSIGNVPLAAILFAGGAGFSGVIAFLYGDLIVIPLLDAYRRYFGWRMAIYIGCVFYATMVIAAIAMDLAFTVAHLQPQGGSDVRDQLSHFSLNYTFWLNLIFGALALYWFGLNHRHPMHPH